MDIETDVRRTDTLTVTSYCEACYADKAPSDTACAVCGWEDEPEDGSPAAIMRAHLVEFGR